MVGSDKGILGWSRETKFRIESDIKSYIAEFEELR
jgi:hypothetical protein